MLLNICSFCTIHKSSVSTGFAKQIMPFLRILCYNGSLITKLSSKLCPSYNHSARTAQKTQFYCCVHACFTEPLPRYSPGICVSLVFWRDPVRVSADIRNYCKVFMILLAASVLWVACMPHSFTVKMEAERLSETSES
jgi:hypothetical protein